jgi:hypothetical protein
LWYVLDFGADQKKDQRQAIDRQLGESLCKVSQEFAGSAQSSHFVNAQTERDLNVTATFENGLQLDRARISNTALKPGDPICVELQWSTASQLPANYTVFAHVLDQNATSSHKAICNPAVVMRPPAVGRSGSRSRSTRRSAAADSSAR